EQILERDRLLIGIRLALESHYVRLPNLKFGSILDGDNSFFVGNGLGEDVQKSRFTGASSAADQQCLSRANLTLKEFSKLARQRATGDKVIHCEMAAGELPDGQPWRGLDRRRNVGANPAAIGQLCVEDWVVFVEPFSKVVGNHFEAGAQAAGVERNARLPEHPSLTLGVPGRVGIAHDFAYFVVE